MLIARQVLWPCVNTVKYLAESGAKTVAPLAPRSRQPQESEEAEEGLPQWRDAAAATTIKTALFFCLVLTKREH